MARALPQALSVDTAEESSVSLVSDSVSVDSTVTLENLPFKPSRLLTPPWSTETSREGVAEDEGVAGVAGGRPRPRLARLPGLPQLARVVVGLGLVIPPAQLLLYLMQILLMYSTDNFASKAMDYGLWSNLCILVCSYQ